MQAIVLAAGEGTRMRPLSEERPKPLLPVGDVPLIEHVLTAAADAGADEFVVVTGYRGDAIRDYLGDCVAGRPITYREQETPDGTAAAVARAAEAVSGQYAVLNGDCLYRRADLEDLLGNGPAIGVTRVGNPQDYGVVSLENGTIESIVEKPDSPPSEYANAGAYVLPPESVELLDVPKSDRGEYELTDAVRQLLDNQRLRAVRFDTWMDIGHPWELLAANESVLAEQDRRIDGSVAEDATIGDGVVIESGATVEPGVHIEGPALIRSGATVGPNASIRGATRLGPGVTVGHAVEIKNSVIMADSAIPHLSYVGDSVIGQNVNLGAGTQIANLRHDREPVRVSVNGDRVSTGREKFGAVIGDGVKTGINTSINPGVKFSPGSHTAPGETVTRDR